MLRGAVPRAVIGSCPVKRQRAPDTDALSKDKNWGDGIGQPRKLGGRVRSQAYLRLTAAVANASGAARRHVLEYLCLKAAVASALGTARRHVLEYLRLKAAVASALGTARRRSCPPQRAAPAPAPLPCCAARPPAQCHESGSLKAKW